MLKGTVEGRKSCVSWNYETDIGWNRKSNTKSFDASNLFRLKNKVLSRWGERASFQKMFYPSWVSNLEVIEQLDIFHHYVLIEKWNDKYIAARKKCIIPKMWTFFKTKTRKKTTSFVMVGRTIFANQYLNAFKTKVLFHRIMFSFNFKVLKLGECTAKWPLDFIRSCIKF